MENLNSENVKVSLKCFVSYVFKSTVLSQLQATPDYKLHLQVSAAFRSLSVYKPHLTTNCTVVHSKDPYATKLPNGNRIARSWGLLAQRRAGLARSGLLMGPGGPAWRCCLAGSLLASRCCRRCCHRACSSWPGAATWRQAGMEPLGLLPRRRAGMEPLTSPPGRGAGRRESPSHQHRGWGKGRVSHCHRGGVELAN